MRKTVGITLTTAALLFGGAGVANATAASAPAPSSTMTTLAEDNGTATTRTATRPVCGAWWAFWSARTRRTQAAQRHQRRPLRGGPRGAWQPEHPGARAKLSKGDSDD